MKVRTIHASCVELEGRGVLLCGDSGAGKTSLLVELLGRGARFLADDSVVLLRESDRLWAEPPKRTEGLIATSPVEAESVVRLFPGVQAVRATSIELCVHIEAEAAGTEAPEALMADIPKLSLQRNELALMADACENAVKGESFLSGLDAK